MGSLTHLAEVGAADGKPESPESISAKETRSNSLYQCEDFLAETPCLGESIICVSMPARSVKRQLAGVAVVHS